ncbi:MAG TPA: ABC transporter permease [Syntrophorhabdales bacterium]|nr:ABC transporter permease [Syntrophorhabdales bacterium]
MQKQEVTIYEPYSRQKIGFLKTWMLMASNIASSRQLIYQIFKRDFFASYKKSFLGISWIILGPLFGIISWVFMNATGILNPGDVGIPYPAYVLLSTSIWGLFVGFFTAAQGTLGSGAAFIMQVKYPHEALLLKQMAQHIANFIVTFLLNIAVLIAFGVIPSWKIVFFPILILPLFFLAAGIGLVVSVVGVVAAEIQTGVNLILSLLVYVTPVIYAPTFKNPALQTIIKWNPLTYLIGIPRDIIIYGRVDHFDRFVITSLASLLVFLLSWRLFFVSEDKVIEKMI